MALKSEEGDMEMGFDAQKPSESHIETLRRNQVHTEIDVQLDKRLDRKFDLHIMPWLFGIWCVFVPDP